MNLALELIPLFCLLQAILNLLHVCYLVEVGHQESDECFFILLHFKCLTLYLLFVLESMYSKLLFSHVPSIFATFIPVEISANIVLALVRGFLVFLGPLDPLIKCCQFISDV